MVQSRCTRAGPKDKTRNALHNLVTLPVVCHLTLLRSLDGGQERYLNAHVSQGGWPVLVLNADFRPLSYYPLSLWSWQDAIKAVFLDCVNIVEHYDPAGRSPGFEIHLPSVVSPKTFVKPTTHPAFNRFNVFLRDRFVCQYCSAHDDLTFHYIVPRSKGGQTTS